MGESVVRSFTTAPGWDLAKSSVHLDYNSQVGSEVRGDFLGSQTCLFQGAKTTQPCLSHAQTEVCPPALRPEKSAFSHFASWASIFLIIIMGTIPSF